MAVPLLVERVCFEQRSGAAARAHKIGDARGSSSLVPLGVRKIKGQRRMFEVAPLLERIQDQYKGRRDQVTRAAVSREVMNLYERTETNLLGYFLPLALQLPIFFALFSVLCDARYGQAGAGPLNEALADQFGNAKLLGAAPLHDSFASTTVVLMTVSQFITQLRLVPKNVSNQAKASSMFRRQR